MKPAFLYKENFYNALFEENCIPEIYSEIKFDDTSLTVSKKTLEKAKINSFSLFPNYLQPKFDSNLFFKKANMKPGFAIKVNGVNNIEDYLKNECKTSFRKVINRSVKRLESCFNISYKMFFGNINKEEYLFLMNELHNMIIHRFNQREGRNRILENWDYYLNFAYQNINNKKASLFIIYNNNEPIEISLNFHCSNIMYSSISSYKLDYSKFSLGNIEIYKQLDWCIKNNITLFDMGFGNFDYKRRWSNFVYHFENHVISNNNLIAKIYSFYLKNKSQLVNYLISKKINDKIYNLIEILKRDKKKIQVLEYDYLDLKSIPVNTNVINVNNKENIFLKKPLYDYLYKYSEHLNNIKIYKITNETNCYVLQGIQSMVKIHL